MAINPNDDPKSFIKAVVAVGIFLIYEFKGVGPKPEEAALDKADKFVNALEGRFGKIT